jgi:glycosyltransferase involved in cell wall biosynthesis
MHICLATREFPPITNGGIATYYVHLAQLLADSGHEVTVLTVGKEGEASPWTYPGVKVITLSHTREKLFRQLRRRFNVGMENAVHSITDGLAMRDWLFANASKLGIEVVETVDYDGAAPFLIENELPPTLVMCHGSNGQVKHYTTKSETPKQKFINSLEVISIALADEVGCYSPMNTNEWECFTGRKPRFIVAPYILATNLPPKNNYRTTNYTGIVVGRLGNLKGALEVIAALDMCVKKGVNVKIRWIGGDQASPLESIKSTKGHLQQHYPHLWGRYFLWEEFLSPAETRRAQFEADFAMVPSRWDSFNFTAVEAMSVGTPVIVSAGAGVSYLFKNMENGIVVPPRDAGALAEAIATLQDENLRSRLGKQGQATVEREFTAEKIVAEHVAAYEVAKERHQYRQNHRYCSSVMGPLVLQWQHSINMATIKRLAYLPRKIVSNGISHKILGWLNLLG